MLSEKACRSAVLTSKLRAHVCGASIEHFSLTAHQYSSIPSLAGQIGIKRPLYVERQPQCLTCPSNKMTRFVPLDPSIPTITSRVLGDKLDDMVDIDPAILPVFLDEIQPASRVSRCEKERNRRRKRLEIQDNTLPKPKASRTGLFPQPLPCPVKRLFE